MFWRAALIALWALLDADEPDWLLATKLLRTFTFVMNEFMLAMS